MLPPRSQNGPVRPKRRTPKKVTPANSIASLPDDLARRQRRSIDIETTKKDGVQHQADAGEDADDERQSDAELLAMARKRFQMSAMAESPLRQEMMEDLRFRAGDQWPDQIRADRVNDKRPILTINRLPQFIKQITNPQRATRPSIQVNPVGDGADKETAEIIQGLIRHIEYNSHAEVAYDEAFEDAVTMGRGWFRILTDYVDDGTFEQEIIVKRVQNQFTVYPDPACQELDYSDARFMFVVEDIPLDEYRQLYGNERAKSLELFSSVGDQQPDWYPEGKVRIAEYWYVEHKPRKIALIRGENGELLTVPSAQVPEGTAIVQEREVQERVIHFIKMNANEVLERKVWPGKWIPIVPVLGDEIDLNGRRDLVGIVRYARDPQRMYNFWVPLSLTTVIPTPYGWTTMGDVQAGDDVLDNKGRPCKVLGKSPVHYDRECFKVTFDDGSNIVADRDHPWQVEERGKRQDPTWEWTTKTITTAELTPKKHFIWATKPLMLDDAVLPVEPYVLGVWLSDGRSDGPTITQKTSDVETLRDALAAHGARFGPVGSSGENAGRFTVNGIRSKLVQAGLLNNKHIPPAYLRASLTQRLALLQGLMDGDGSIAIRNRVCEFSTGSDVMRDGVVELLRTLGIKGKCVTREPRTAVMKSGREIVGKLPVHQVWFSAPPPETMPVFALPRKFASQAAKNGKYHPRRTDRWQIVSVEAVPSVPTQCIGVDSPDHLFLAGPSMIPTHNSAETEMIALAPRTPVVGAEGQFKGHEAEWRVANVRNVPYLEYVPKALEGQPIPPPQRQQFEPPIQAIVAATKQADNDLKSVTSLFDASLGERGPEESGKAILARQKQGETANVNFVDNLARALWHAGRIYIDLIPHVYDTARTLHIMRADDQQSEVKINQEFEEKGIKKIYQMGVGRYNITLSIGPGYLGRRQEAVAAMLQLVQAAPQMIPIIGDLMVGEMDWPVAGQIAARLKKTLPPALQDDNENNAIPPALKAHISQLEQMVQQQHQLLGQQKQMLDGKQMELQATSRDMQAKIESEERREVIRANAGIAEAALKGKAEKDATIFEAATTRLSEAMEHLKDLHMQMNDQAHEQDMATQAQAHEKAVAAMPPPVDPNAQSAGGGGAS